MLLVLGLLGFIPPTILAVSHSDCRRVIDDYVYDYSSLRGTRFEVPTPKDGETLVFSICGKVDNKDAVAYLKNIDNQQDKIIGSLAAPVQWKPLTEQDEELGGIRHIGAQLTYYEHDSTDGKNSQWTFQQRFLCSFDTEPVLQSYDVNYNDRVAIVDIAAEAACPINLHTTPSFLRRHWFAMGVGAISASLMLGLSSGLSYTTFAALIGFLTGFYTIGYMWMYMVFNNNAWLEGPSTWLFFHSVFGFLLAATAAGSTSLFFSHFPAIAICMAGILAGGSLSAMVSGLAHTLFSDRLSDNLMGWMEMITVLLGGAQGGLICYKYGPDTVPIVAAVLGGYGITWTLGFLTSALPRQADVFANIHAWSRTITGKDSNPTWWPIRGDRNGFFGTALLWFLFLTSVVGFLMIHVSAYEGLHRARVAGDPIRFHGGVEEPAGDFFEEAGQGPELEISYKLRTLWRRFMSKLGEWMPFLFPRQAPHVSPMFDNMALEQESWWPNNGGGFRQPLLDKSQKNPRNTYADASTQVSAGNNGYERLQEWAKSAVATPVRAPHPDSSS